MIRDATPADLDAIVALGERFRTSTAYRLRVASTDRVRELAASLMSAEDGLVLVAEAATGDLVGLLAVIVHAQLFSGTRVAGEIAWWVDPDHRGALGIRLLRAAEAWARRRGAETLEMIAPNGQVARIYERLGYVPVEQSYQRRLQP